MKRNACVVAWLSGIAVAGLAMAQEVAPEYPKLTAGGEFRLRQEAFDYLPIKVDPPGETRGGYNNYMRFRTLLWGQLELNDMVTAYVRLANEFRHYYDPESTDSWDYPDEVVVDNAYLDIHNLLSDKSLSFRIGRQDLFAGPRKPFGTGKLILEGTPKDGSRTIYFDAVRATWKKADTQIDAIGIYNRADGQLFMNDQDRDLTGLTSGYNDMDEYGGVLYGAFKPMADLGAESYYMYKVESRWDNAATRMPSLNLHTVGGRLMPQFIKDRLSGNLEAAYQMGERGDQDVAGYMVDVLVKGMFMSESAAKPWASAGVYCLSGDDPKSKDDEGWNPLWARYPQFGLSDLLIYTYDADGAGRWSNLTAPYLSAGLVPHKNAKLSVMVSQLMAPEDNGPGTGDQRGLYEGVSYDVLLAKGKVTAKDELRGLLQLEFFDPGNYYKAGINSGYFLRWELKYSF
jgi:hypothetical protein